VRLAGAADADAVARMLHDFNREYDEPTPGPEAVARRVRELLDSGEITVLLVGDAPDGLALLRFKPSLWAETREAYLEELYVVPPLRGQGRGRTLMEAVLELAREHGAGYISLCTSEGDVAARALYESIGFTNREGRPDGPVMYFYEREL
jgi:ribosomal protein S18 acetylase RimI-like enzyme